MKTISIILLAFTLSSCAVIQSAFQRKQPEPPKFTVSLRSQQIPLGTVEMQRDRNFPFSGLERTDVNVIYFPEEDAVCLNYRSDFFTYHFFWDVDGRELFLKALETYNRDFDNRNLPNNPRRTRAAYGSTDGFLIWQEFSFARRLEANMIIEIGFLFRERSPYFAVTQKQAVVYDVSDSREETLSQEITMYFTRAQAQELADFFSEELLRTHAVPRAFRPGMTSSPDADAW
jgi:hypothetical protein